MRMAFIFNLIIFIITSNNALAKDQIYQFGILNQASPEATKKLWDPILSYVYEQTKIKLVIVQGKDVAETDKMMAEGKFDFIYTNHHLHERYNSLKLKALVKFKNEDIRGEIITKHNSSIKKLEDLARKNIGYPNNSALVAYYVPKIKLFQMKLDRPDVFFGDQEKTLNALINSDIEAIGINSTFLKKYEDNHKDLPPFRRLFSSELYSAIPIVYYPKVPKSVIAKVKKALLAKGFVQATDDEYNNARKIYKTIDNDI